MITIKSTPVPQQKLHKHDYLHVLQNNIAHISSIKIAISLVAEKLRFIVNFQQYKQFYVNSLL